MVEFSFLFLLFIYMYFGYNKINQILFVCIWIILLLLILIYYNLVIFHSYYILVTTWKYFFILFIIYLTIIILNIKPIKRWDVIFLYLIVSISAISLIISHNLLFIFLSLELQTFSLLILISYEKNQIKSLESGLKYFILGALSSGLYLLGVVFLFKYNLSVNIDFLNYIICDNKSIIKLSYLLIILSLFFKLALFPFHFWISDIFEGSNSSVMCLIATIPKLSVLVIIVQLINFDYFIIISGTFSIIIGTLGAYNQTKLKRLIAYSGISHLGFILIGVSLCNQWGNEIAFLYLIIYILCVLPLCILIIITYFSKDYYIIELSGLYNDSKLVSWLWAIIFFSIAGIPPLIGFLSKWLLLWVLFSYNYVYLSLIGIIFSILGVGYYLRIIKLIYFEKITDYLNWEVILKDNKFNSKLNYYVLSFLIYFHIFNLFNPIPMICIISLFLSNFF
uniref:NADH:ubiquinone reductase (H(+)-translocating) n=1 Tax=Plotocnide borealis TaxID=1755686 RepID=A0A0S2IBD1_9CNID|nr:NADH dehydrogenase subunit 2 [Plotocnide borealis]